MANKEQLKLIKEAIKKNDIGIWNKWRKENPDVKADLSRAHLMGADLSAADLHAAHLIRADLSAADLRGADLSAADLSGTNLRGTELSVANLSGADLSAAHLIGADLRGADLNAAHLYTAYLSGADLRGVDLSGANLSGANLSGADLSGAHLIGANLRGADLSAAVLSGADLSAADLSRTLLVKTNLQNATLVGCNIYGISAWGLELKETTQSDLIITPPDEPSITVDKLEVAQFIYLLLHNPKIRDVINTIGKKAVLILGRFTDRKNVLEVIREEVRQRGYLPIVFDFERPTDRDFTETVMTLAGMSRFIIADITKPKSVPLELQATVPNYMIPFVPIIENGEEPFSMFQDLWQKHGEWVLNPLRYESLDQLRSVFDTAVINRANERYAILVEKKAKRILIEDARDYEVETRTNSPKQE
jgi:uncharacterized protein YjbI with pentapeptide repeats